MKHFDAILFEQLDSALTLCPQITPQGLQPSRPPVPGERPGCIESVCDAFYPPPPPPPPLPWPLLGVSDCCRWYDDVFVVWWHDTPSGLDMHSRYWVSDASDLQQNGQIFFQMTKALADSSSSPPTTHLCHCTLQLLHRNSGTCVLTATVHSRGGGGGYLVGSAVTLASYWMQVFVRLVPCCILDWKRIAE